MAFIFRKVYCICFSQIFIGPVSGSLSNGLYKAVVTVGGFLMPKTCPASTLD